MESLSPSVGLSAKEMAPVSETVFLLLLRARAAYDSHPVNRRPSKTDFYTILTPVQLDLDTH